uniref:RHS repeat-associated core domain-containing protein n=1 Tax=Robiginitomaculum antarcticum TaxID=437507 RepID=UPI000374027A|nr:RHS repeat-associated core domain-containing protein [Robiginitomaculum antarcticum]
MSDQPVVISGAVSGSYLYDGNLKRVKSVMNNETIYNIYDSSGVISMVDPVAGNDQFTYVRLAGQVSARIHRYPGDTSPSDIQYLHSDHLGSPVAGTDSAGNVAWRERYTPYGEKLLNPAALDNQAAFTGHIYDAPTGLTYMQARYYDPNIGRFLSIDPVTFMDTGNPAMFNRYAYVENDPINGIDPTGMIKITVGASAKVSVGPGGRVGASISYDTNGHTFSVKGLVGARVGAAGAISVTGAISESGDFAKSDVMLGVAVDAEACAGFAKATAEASASLRDGFSGDAGVDDADCSPGAASERTLGNSRWSGSKPST